MEKPAAGRQDKTLTDIDKAIMRFFKGVSPKLSKINLDCVFETLGIMKSQQFADYRLAMIFGAWTAMNTKVKADNFNEQLAQYKPEQSIFEGLLQKTDVASRLGLLSKLTEAVEKDLGREDLSTIEYLEQLNKLRGPISLSNLKVYDIKSKRRWDVQREEACPHGSYYPSRTKGGGSL